MKMVQGDHAMLAIIARVIAALFTAIMSAFAKAAGQAGAHPAEIIFFRSALALPVVLIWIVIGPGLGAISTKRPMAHLTRAAIGLASMCCVFYALSLLPLAEAITIFFLAPLIATCLSALFLNDQVGIHRWTAIFVGLVGVLVLIWPGAGDVEIAIWGLIVAAIAAVLMAGVTITLRQIGSTENHAAIVFWFTLTGTIVIGCIYPLFYRPHPWQTWALMAAVGASGAVVQIFMTMSLRLAPVSLTAPFDYTQLFWACLLGWLFWADLPALTTIIGGLLIAGAGIYTFYRERTHRQSIAAPSTPGN